MNELTEYLTLVQVRNERESIFNEIIKSYIRVLGGEFNSRIGSIDHITQSESNSKNVQQLKDVRIALLQTELVDVHFKRNELTKENELMRQQLKETKEANLLLLKDRKSIEVLLEEKLKALDTLHRSLELQADEYRTLQLQYNTMNDSFSKIKQENEVLMNRLTQKQIVIADELNCEVMKFNERRAQHTSNQPLFSSRSKSPSIRQSVANIFDQLLSPITGGSANISSTGVSNAKPSTHVRCDLPDKVQYTWKCSDVDNYATAFNPAGSLAATSGASRKISLWIIDEIKSISS
ncbi:hypothetical protein GJ496_012073 [Pomphorhynchus laevis]|nr:hypothetical protein GJ496_012073 [Pomphorhynchus laevis]